jgi:L,D-transpeptidase ErfK/SrfK
MAVAAGLGYREMVDANASVDPWVPGDGTAVRVPRFWVLPEGPRRGIVVNLAEMRLYHYFNKDGKKLVATYPVGIGREAFDTPQGAYRISHKTKDPTWIVPESILKDNPDFPRVVPPGPNNPLGKYALRLSGTEYLLHGTNRPFGIGRRVSHGCIRMYPGDIEELFGATKEGERVRVVYQPVKAGERGGEVFVEVHKDYLKEGEELWAETTRMLSRLGLLEGTDSGLLHFALEARTGVPFVVSPGDAKTPAVARAE